MDEKVLEKMLEEHYYLGQRHGLEMMRAFPRRAEEILEEIIKGNKDGIQK